MAEEQKDGAEGEAKEAAPKKKLPLALIAIGLQILVILGAAGALLYYGVLAKKPQLTSMDHLERAMASVKDSELDTRYLEPGEIMLNLNGNHRIRTKLMLEVSHPNVETLIKSKMPIIESLIMDTFSHTKPEELNAFEGKLKIKEAIKDRINERLIADREFSGVVRDVYLLEFMLK